MMDDGPTDLKISRKKNEKRKSQPHFESRRTFCDHCSGMFDFIIGPNEQFVDSCWVSMRCYDGASFYMVNKIGHV